MVYLKVILAVAIGEPYAYSISVNIALEGHPLGLIHCKSNVFIIFNTQVFKDTYEVGDRIAGLFKAIVKIKKPKIKPLIIVKKEKKKSC